MTTDTIGKVIQRSWMDMNGLRLDSGPYLSGAFEARVALERLQAEKEPLNKVVRPNGIYHAGREGRTYVDDPKHGVPFLGSTDILAADLSRLPLLSKRQVAANPLFTLEEGWTLITRSGTVGRMAYVRPDMAGMACSEHVMRVVPDPERILPGYLYAYLSSRYGVPQVVSGTYGAVIQHIEPGHIADLPVPIPPPELGTKIHQLVHKSGQSLAQYQLSINQATQILLTTAGIEEPLRHKWFNDKSDLGFSISSSGIDILRGWNHSRRVQELKDQIQSRRHDRLGDLVDLDWLRWRKLFARIDADPEHGIELITQKPLFRLFPEGRWLSRDYLLNHSPKYIVPDQTILIAKQGTLGEDELYCRCEFITGKGMLKYAYSDHCMRIVALPGRVLPGYLFAFLRSEIGFRLLRVLSEGSKQQDLHYRTVPELLIPRCDTDIEQQVHDMIVSAFRFRNEAVDMQFEARRLVEQWIAEDA